VYSLHAWYPDSRPSVSSIGSYIAGSDRQTHLKQHQISEETPYKSEVVKSIAM